MTDLHFYYALECPSSRAALMAIHAFSLIDSIGMTRYDLNKKEHINEHYRKINPRLKVPALTIDGVVITESRAIITYLADKYLPQDNEIYPHELITRAQINAALYFDLVVLYGPLHSYVLPKCIPGMPDLNPDLTEQKAVEALDQMELLISETGPFIRGDRLTVVDLSALGPAVMLLGIEYPLDRWPKFDQWLTHCRTQMPWFEACNRVGIDRLKQMYAAKIAATAAK